MTGASQKFRPYFTADELTEIITCLKSHPSTRRIQLAQYLEGFLLKISHGIVTPAHITKPTLTIEQKLGFSSVPIPIPHHLTGEAAYQKWLTNPLSATPKEIEEAQDWRYRNDLMSPDEEREYERR